MSKAMTQGQVELQRNGQPLGAMPVAEVHTFGAIYDSLPRPIYRFVTEPQFIDFCLRHRRRLLGAEESKPD